jgi:hypothetical protein
MWEPIRDNQLNNTVWDELNNQALTLHEDDLAFLNTNFTKEKATVK